MSRRDCRKEQDVSFDSCAFKFKQRKSTMPHARLRESVDGNNGEAEEA